MVIERFEESQARIEVRAYKQEDVRVAMGAMAEDCRVRSVTIHTKKHWLPRSHCTAQCTHAA